MKVIGRGVYSLTLGTPEKYTPFQLLHPKYDPEKFVSKNNVLLPFKKEDIIFKQNKRGCVIEIPMNKDENFFGFGLQFYSVNHTGKRRYIKVNSDPKSDTGESHAPVPFYISTGGYGLYVDTARYVSFFCGSTAKKGASRGIMEDVKQHVEFSETALYSVKKAKEDRIFVIDIPVARGVDLYFFSGDIKTVVSNYNLFSGGGCVPPMWGLGNWYRAYGGAAQQDIVNLGEYFRNSGIPVDVLGIEPGWHSHSYSCSYKWNRQLFEEPQRMIDCLSHNNYKINLWEHLFVHPSSEIYNDIYEYAGDNEVWNGLVPDFGTEEAKRVFKDYHQENFIDRGIKGFKLDECDNSDYNSSAWSFPETTEFPSGMDGEVAHSMIGLLYQSVIEKSFRERNQRTFSQVRSSHGLAASMPFVLYSDLYDHKAFITALVNSGFSGFLWSPEIRSCHSETDLIRRLQTVVFSPQSLLNCWRIPNPPWLQVDLKKNLNNELSENREKVTKLVKKFMDLRMVLLPYLYSAFYEYFLKGIPPVRALVMDYPKDEKTYFIADEYLFGPDILVAPLLVSDMECSSSRGKREVYLPDGIWYDFFTDEKYVGGKTYQVNKDIESAPVFVKSGTLLPLAEPVLYVAEDTVFNITCKAYGAGRNPAILYEDDMTTYDYEKGIYNKVTISWDGKEIQSERVGSYQEIRYKFTGVNVVI